MTDSKIITDWNEWKEFSESLQPSKWVIFTDKNTSQACLPYFLERWNPTIELEHISMDAGEEFKSLTTAQSVWEEMMSKGIDRDAVFISVGGGVVCDLGGYIASTYKRGIRSVYIPTTNLAMVDAAIGGKNGVNLNGIKNQIGTFRNPEAIVIDAGFLSTLDARQLRSGYAETIKHALISDRSFWNEVQSSGMNSASDLIMKSMQVKLSVIKEDFEDRGPRQSLNFGHTIGHAIEAQSQDSNAPLLHGEAVAFGIVAESWISTQLTGLTTTDFEHIHDFIVRKFDDLELSFVDIEDCVERMKQDKKNSNDAITCSLLESIGSPLCGVQVSKSLLQDAMKFTLSKFAR